jgi:uncharacterized membrane protein
MGRLDGLGMMHDTGSNLLFALTVSFLVVIAACVVIGYVVRRAAHGDEDRRASAVEMLEQRLALGEIDDEEFLRRRSGLDAR